MDNDESLIGKWAAYYLEGDCCFGYGKIIGIGSFGFIEIDEYPGGIKKTGIDRENVRIFNTPEEASECYHKDDKKREEILRREYVELHS